MYSLITYYVFQPKYTTQLYFEMLFKLEDFFFELLKNAFLSFVYIYTTKNEI